MFIKGWGEEYSHGPNPGWGWNAHGRENKYAKGWGWGGPPYKHGHKPGHGLYIPKIFGHGG